MKYLLSFILLFIAAGAAVSADYKLSWDPYVEPEGHDIQIYCRINEEESIWRTQLPATENERIVALNSKPGDTVACKIRARRMVGEDREQWPKSEFTEEVAYTVPLEPAPDPTVPEGLKLVPADQTP